MIDNKPITYEEIRSGMRLWNSKTKCWQKVLRTYLWKDILAENPDTYYKQKINRGSE
jgi:hypothetical protein